MPVLHNLVSNKELKARMLAETEPRTTVSFYKYFTIADPKAFRDELYLGLTALKVFGRIYVAHEGINAQLSVPASQYEAMKAYLYGFDPALNHLRMNIALDDDGKSFWVLRLKVRDRIVADGIDDETFDASNVGNYLKAAEVNAMLDDPDAVFVDMRNHYEYEVGRFDNALEVPADTFRDQLPMAVDMLKDKKDKKIVMYCTGGFAAKKPAPGCAITGSKMFITSKAALLSMRAAHGNKIFRCVSKARTLSLMNAWASVFRMMCYPTATSAGRRVTPT